jgi:hypothetical protein
LYDDPIDGTEEVASSFFRLESTACVVVFKLVGVVLKVLGDMRSVLEAVEVELEGARAAEGTFLRACIVS